MKRLWRIIGFVVIVLFIAGALFAGTGLLTGASTERVWNEMGMREQLIPVLRQLQQLRALLPI